MKINESSGMSFTTDFPKKGCDKMIEYDQYRLDLEAMSDAIIELRDSL